MPKKAAPTHSMISLTRVGLLAGLRLRIWRISSTPLALLRSDGRSDVGRAARGNDPAARQDLAHVVEHDHAVTQQAPPLLRMDGDSVGGVAVRAVSRRARGVVWTHCAPLVWAADVLGLVDPVVFGAGPAKTVRTGVRCGRHPKVPMPVESSAAGQWARQCSLGSATGSARDQPAWRARATALRRGASVWWHSADQQRRGRGPGG